MAFIETSVKERKVLPCAHDNHLEVAEHEDCLELTCTHCQASVRLPIFFPSRMEKPHLTAVLRGQHSKRLPKVTEEDLTRPLKPVLVFVPLLEEERKE